MKYLFSVPETLSTSEDGQCGAPRLMPTSDDHSDPRTVIRGESFNDTSPADEDSTCLPNSSAHPFSAHTDWLNCTIPLTAEPNFLEAVMEAFRNIAGDCFGPLIPTGRGLHGWTDSFDIGTTRGKLAIGGQNSTMWLSLPGAACTLIPLEGWTALSIYFSEHLNAKITRWDGAVDDYEGLHSVDWAVSQFKTGQFTAGGNKPSCNQRGNWIEPDGRGRTFYVGKRENGKLIRIYEKGKQLGDPNSPWVRWEVELHNTRRLIPWDVLTRPGQYVAGAYPSTRWAHKESCRIKTAQKTEEITYDSLTHYARQGYGKHLNVMFKKEGSAEKVMERLVREGRPARLEIPSPPEQSPEDN